MAIGVAVFHLETTAFEVTEIAKSQQKLTTQILHRGVLCYAGVEVTEPENLRLLRPCHDWPRRRSSNASDEGAPPHSLLAPCRQFERTIGLCRF